MLRSLVGSEMCIRDRYQRRVRGTPNHTNMGCGSSASDSDDLRQLLGPELMTKDGARPTLEALAGKQHIMLYFSAHWCPPCRGYTPQLSEAYAASDKKESVAVVFLSSDKDQAAFDNYYADMSFFAMPYSDRNRKEELSSKYGVKGIPTLVLLDAGGTLVEQNIRGDHGKFL
eukprot:TRINITY_DN1097_c0_g1_i16.p1 TRINITY_DN1097_c0_g1~~TRINITY_DN1097_c0_g1_i16.p1  ORF type:complete len:172 (-),score=48.88 TRINITY_DN1097_c0_g1_i16:499-1014(-)